MHEPYGMSHIGNKNHENSKHQKANYKQIPMTQIRKSKQMICIWLFPPVSFQAGHVMGDNVIEW
jgi:hypothetical protein